MPWITLNNGEKKYKPSIYTKEELPTWNEIYTDFYKGNINYYHSKSNDQYELDMYWKIPRKKVILVTMCNQLNKLLYEDGKLSKTLDFIHQEILNNPIDIKFTCDILDTLDKIPIAHQEYLNSSYENYLDRWVEKINKLGVGNRNHPPIYTIPLPTGVENPFIINNDTRINVNDIDEDMCLTPIILFDTTEGNKIYNPRPFDDDSKEDYDKIIKFLLKDVIEYFENGIGWKDEDGKVIDSIPNPKCISGYDPAL